MSRPRRALTEPAAEAAVDQACRMLRLPTMRNPVGELITIAAKEQITYRGFLAELLLAEREDRDRRRSERQIKGAGFPREKWLTDFDFDAKPEHQPGRDQQPLQAAAGFVPVSHSA